ncbi:MAG TPA: heme biosynthesis HemY N-terminal domain-containing protein [Methylocella sp.]|nr:heme biosynthesis HemY N-terminal domain-containing protein [Methylocella sp.]
MLRVPLFLLLLIILAIGEAWLVDRPGEISLSWQGYRIHTSLLVALTALTAAIVALFLLWSGIRFVLRLPPSVSGASRARRRERGYAALSQGIIAVGTGDTRRALKAAAEAQRLIPNEPLALLLRAEAAQLAGDHPAVETTFKAMTQREDMRLLGFRGLHAHAHRRGDPDAAHEFATAAHGIAALPWSASAVVEKHVMAKDWQGAADALNKSGNLLDKPSKDRQSAVLATVIGLEKEENDPQEALRLARAAVNRAPSLVPAVALAARLLGRQSQTRRALKMIEAAWPLGPHPELAKDYLELLPEQTHAQRLERARRLAKLASRDPESLMLVARAAIAAGDYKLARDTMLPLIQRNERPTVRMCLLMAELEEAEHGESGFSRDWLARATRAPRDATWIAGAVMSDQWLPAVPGTGKLDVFVWQKPDESLRAKNEADDAIFRPVSLPPTEEPPLIEKWRPAIPGPGADNAASEAASSSAGNSPDNPHEEQPTGPINMPAPVGPGATGQN